MATEEYINAQMLVDYEAQLAAVEARKPQIWDVTVNEFDGPMDGNGEEVPSTPEGEPPPPMQTPIIMPGDALAVSKSTGQKLTIAAADLGTAWVPYEE